MVISKDLFGYLSIAVEVVATVPYWRLILRGTVKPHVFSWVIWALVAGIAAAARGADDAGAGAWGAWAGGVSCASIAVVALFKGDKNITRSDVITFLVALAAIPAWLITDNPLYAVLIVTFIDVLGYFPTARKSYIRPHEEMIFNYVAANLMHVASLFATEHYSVTTVLMPVVMLTVNTMLITMIAWRRRVVDAEAAAILKG